MVADGPGGPHSHLHDHQHGRGQLARVGRQGSSVPGGVDFSNCVTDPDTGCYTFTFVITFFSV